MSETPHSPLPWRADESAVRSTTETSPYDIADLCIASCWPAYGSGLSHANARYIVTACNAFPELLAALSRMLTCHRAAMDAAQSGAFEIQDRECRCGACDQARAVIAKAEGR